MRKQKLALYDELVKMHGMESIIFIKCCICHTETPAWFDENDKPDIPSSWRALSTECCPKQEVYACSPKCTMRCGFVLSRNHHGEVIVREVEAIVDDDEIMEMLNDCEQVESIPKGNGGPGFNDWELEFLDSCRNRMADNGQLTGKQIEKLQELWDRI